MQDGRLLEMQLTAGHPHSTEGREPRRIWRELLFQKMDKALIESSQKGRVEFELSFHRKWCDILNEHYESIFYEGGRGHTVPAERRKVHAAASGDGATTSVVRYGGCECSICAAAVTWWIMALTESASIATRPNSPHNLFVRDNFNLVIYSS